MGENRERFGSLLVAAVCALFFFSGVSALILEVVWTRLAELVIGNSVRAASTIIGVYMLGLGMGAWGAGRRKFSRPLIVYAVLEGFIVLWALAVPTLVALLQTTLPWLQLGGIGLVRVLACGLLFLPPTLCMGATLPVLTGVVAQHRESFGGRFGMLYGGNTVGAMTGAVLAGFFLLPALGLSGSAYVAVAMNTGAAIFALLLARRRPALLVEPSIEAKEEVGASRKGLVALAAAAGFLSLFLEVFWFRILVQVFGATTYSLSAMLAVFLGGAGLGALVLGRLGDRRGQHEAALRAIAWCAFLAGACLVGSCWLIGGLPERFFASLAASGFTWEHLVWQNFWLSVQVILPPAFLLGGILPLTARALRNGAGTDSATVAGRVYLFNAVAGAFGVLLAGFVVLPTIGLRSGLLVAGGLAAVLGLAAILWARAWRLLALPLVFGMVTALTVQHPWDLKKFALGAYFGPQSNGSNVGVRFDDLLATSKLLLFREGVAATIAVLKSHDGSLYYLSDGKVEAETSRRSMINERLIGHLGMLLHPGPVKRVLNIGLGAGVTLGALGSHASVESLQVAELEPATRDVARLFGRYNDDVMNHPKLQMTVEDGRNFLLMNREPFDVISSDPFEPVVAGAIHLFTKEHFELARSRLRENGILCQWIPMYELSTDDYQALVATFAAVFPDTLYFTTGSDSILVGFKDGIQADPIELKKRLEEPAVAESLRAVGFTNPAELWGMLVADFSQTPPPVPARLNTDDDPFVEFSAPRHTLERTDLDNRQLQLDLQAAGRNSREKSVFLSAFPEAQRVVIERQREALGWALRSGVTDDPEKKRQMVEKALGLAPRHPLVREEAAMVFSDLGLQARTAGDREGALKWTKRAYQLQPTDFIYHYRFASALLSEANSAEAETVIEQGVAKFPESPYFLSLLASWYLRNGEPARSVEYHDAAVAKAPQLRFLWEQYGQAVAMLRDPELTQHFLKRQHELQGPG